MRALGVLIAFVQFASASCIALDGDRISGRHLALADPQFAAFPADLTIGFAPSPGAKRVFTMAELARLARSRDVKLGNVTSEPCFEFAMKPVSSDDAVAAMRAGLPRSATIELVELPSTPAPVGELHFPATSLEPGKDIRTWRGYVQYTPTRRSPVWARVRVECAMEALVLTSDVARGAALSAAAYEPRVVSGLTPPARVATRPEELVGTVSRMALKAGETIPLSALEHPPAIRRGDLVRVEVRCGPALLQLDAVAQKPAREGDIVEFLNPLSGKLFRARVAGSIAVVTVGGSL